MKLQRWKFLLRFLSTFSGLLLVCACGQLNSKNTPVYSAVAGSSAFKSELSSRERQLLAIWGETKKNGEWTGIKGNLKALLTNSSSYPGNLYSFQIVSHLVFDYAYSKNNQAVMDDIASLTLIPFQHLSLLQAEYKYFTGKYAVNEGWESLPLARPSAMWLDLNGRENVLSSGQFLYLVAHEINTFLDGGIVLTRAMKDVVKEMGPIVTSHFERWATDKNGVYHVIGWRCTNQNRFTLPDFLTASYQKRLGDNLSYCNYMDDGAIQIVAGMAELLQAHYKSPIDVPLSAVQITLFKNTVEVGMRLIEQRLVDTQLKDFLGRSVLGATIDSGVWTEHPDYRYAGLNSTQFPISPTSLQAVTEAPSKSVSWDISHARRFVFLMESFNKASRFLGIAFKGPELVQKLANQMTYKVFNRDFTNPKFSNFWDGSNGWYRVGYLERAGWGFSPSSLSAEWLGSGYCVWKQFNPDLKKICDATWKMAQSKNTLVAAERKKTYEDGLYSNYAPQHRNIFDLSASSKSQEMLLFLAALEM